MTPDFRYMRWAILRQLPIVTLIALGLIAATGLVATVIPATYTATARLLVEATAVSNDQRATYDSSSSAAHLQNIENRLLTQTRLQSVIDRLQVAQNVEDLRDATTFETLSGRGKATTMTIDVTLTDPELAARVANLMAEDVLAEHQIIRTERANEALKFFRQEVADRKSTLDGEFSKLFAFKSAHAGALPEDAARYHDQRKTLVSQLVPRAPLRVTSTAEQRLRTELSAARAIYAEQHPVVQALEAKIARFDPVSAPDVNADPALLQQLTQLDAALAAIPGNGVRLDTLQRDYDLAEVQYTSAVDRLEAAAVEERIALRSKGERLSLVERAALPDAPSGPRQKIILASGILLSFLITIGVGILRARADTRIRRPKDLERALGLMPYAVIPQMKPV